MKWSKLKIAEGIDQIFGSMKIKRLWRSCNINESDKTQMSDPTDIAARDL